MSTGEKFSSQAAKGPYLGINIGGTRCSMATGDAAGGILERRSWNSREAPSPTDAIQRIFREFNGFSTKEKPISAGVAIGGPMDRDKGEILGPPNLPGWERVHLKELLEEHLGIPVRVEHDAAACALAEARFGMHAGCGSLVYLTCGTGFGAGIVLHGKILEGNAGLHPEIGHWRLLEDGPVAFGRKGCAEALCSGPGLSRIAAWLHARRWTGIPPDPPALVQLAREGDADALDVLDFHARMTGRVCSMIAELLCPERILLGSLAHHIGSLWSDAVIRHYREEVLSRIGDTVAVCPATLQENLQDLSALVIAIEAGT